MPISDWSSAVCSSDLHLDRRDEAVADARDGGDHALAVGRGAQRLAQFRDGGRERALDHDDAGPDRIEQFLLGHDFARAQQQFMEHFERFRSEEHTSELQSLMRNSYAVFCLKKKKYHSNYKT